MLKKIVNVWGDRHTKYPDTKCVHVVKPYEYVKLKTKWTDLRWWIRDTQHFLTSSHIRNRWMDNGLRIWTTDYYLGIKKNEIITFAEKWVDLEILMLSEWATLKVKYHVFSHTESGSINTSQSRSQERTTWGRETRGWGIWEGVNKIKVHYMHAWKSHNETPYFVQ
jgi:hypothetical protein